MIQQPCLDALLIVVGRAALVSSWHPVALCPVAQTMQPGVAAMCLCAETTRPRSCHSACISSVWARAAASHHLTPWASISCPSPSMHMNLGLLEGAAMMHRLAPCTSARLAQTSTDLDLAPMSAAFGKLFCLADACVSGWFEGWQGRAELWASQPRQTGSFQWLCPFLSVCRPCIQLPRGQRPSSCQARFTVQ